MTWTDPTKRQVLMCLHCIAHRKQAESAGTAEADLPQLQPGITLLRGELRCYKHITFKPGPPLTDPGRQG
jgi:hypothetical protein